MFTRQCTGSFIKKGETRMRKLSMLISVLMVLLVFVTYISAQTPPKEKQQPSGPPTHTGNVISLQGSTLTVTGGKGGQTAFNTATASWPGYASSAEVKAGDPVEVSYSGTIGGLKKAISVKKQGAIEIHGSGKNADPAPKR
jgi:hypothetical protein